MRIIILRFSDIFRLGSKRVRLGCLLRQKEQNVDTVRAAWKRKKRVCAATNTHVRDCERGRRMTPGSQAYAWCNSGWFCLPTFVSRLAGRGCTPAPHNLSLPSAYHISCLPKHNRPDARRNSWCASPHAAMEHPGHAQVPTRPMGLVWCPATRAISTR